MREVFESSETEVILVDAIDTFTSISCSKKYPLLVSSTILTGGYSEPTVRLSTRSGYVRSGNQSTKEQIVIAARMRESSRFYTFKILIFRAKTTIRLGGLGARGMDVAVVSSDIVISVFLYSLSRLLLLSVL